MGFTDSTLSYSAGDRSPELWDMTIAEVLRQTASRFPESTALVSRPAKQRFTWRELEQEATRVARALMALGIEKGDRVGIWATNCTEWVLAQFGTAKMGAILVNLNIRYRAAEVEYALKQSQCQSLILIRGFQDCDYVESLFNIAPDMRGGRSGEFKSEKLPNLRNVIYIGEDKPAEMLGWNELVQLAEKTSVDELNAREASLNCHDAINIQYTSGTTGFPKGATLTHSNVANNGLLISTVMKYTDRDSICIPVPFFHCFGMVLANMSALASGAAMVIPSEAFDPLATLQAIHEERCTSVYGVPTMFIAQLQHPKFKEFDVTSLRTGIMAGSNCPIELMRRVVDEMHCHELTIVYGLTESSPGMTQTRLDDPLELRVTTVGRALPHTEIKVVDPSSGQILPHGGIGEICTRGYLVMKGYYNDPKSTAATIEPDGWLHSGDLGTMDENGYVRVTGRIKEMIIRGGENIYPREIEEFLYTCPGIENVQIVGVPSEKYGEEVMAWIKLKSGAEITPEQVIEFCRGKIASFKIPRHIRFVDGFPMTGSGKIQKFKMREAFVAEMKAAEQEKALERAS
jgi:fatty-acyl-CoA synthase